MISRPWLVLPANALAAALALWLSASVDRQPSPAAVVGVVVAAMAVAGGVAAVAGSRVSLSAFGAVAAAAPLVAQLPVGERWRALAWSSVALVPGLVALDVALHRRRNVRSAMAVLCLSAAWCATRIFLVDAYRRVECGLYCRPNPLAVDHVPELARGLAIATGGAAVVWCLLSVRHSRARDAAVCMAVAIVSICVVANGDWLTVLQPRSTVDRSTLVVALVALAFVVIDGVARDVRQVLLWFRIRQLSDSLGTDDAGGLQRRLRDATHDPSLRLLYPLHDGRLVDAEGAVCDDISGALRLTRRDEVVAMLLTEAGPGVVSALSTHLVVAIENEGLLLRSRALLDELQRSRQRLVASADETRHQLERDLHDGAQQRLLAVTMLLAAAERDDDDASRVEAMAEATAALNELRRIARGLYPVSLDRLGLVPALQTYLDESPVAMGLHLDGVEERMPAPLERVVYRIVRTYVESAGESGAQVAEVRVERQQRTVIVGLEHDGTAVADLTDIEDRVGAVGGTWRAEPHTSGHRATAVLPCE